MLGARVFFGDFAVVTIDAFVLPLGFAVVALLFDLGLSLAFLVDVGCDATITTRHNAKSIKVFISEIFFLVFFQ